MTRDEQDAVGPVLTLEEARLCLSLPEEDSTVITFASSRNPNRDRLASPLFGAGRAGVAAALVRLLEGSCDDLDVPRLLAEMVRAGDSSPAVLAALAALRSDARYAFDAQWALHELDRGDDHRRERHLAALLEHVARVRETPSGEKVEIVSMLRTLAAVRDRRVALAVLSWTRSPDPETAKQAAYAALASGSPPGVDGDALAREVVVALPGPALAAFAEGLVDGSPRASERGVAELVARYRDAYQDERGAAVARALGAFGPLARPAVPWLLATVEEYASGDRAEPSAPTSAARWVLVHRCRSAVQALGAIGGADAGRAIVRVAECAPREEIEPLGTALRALGAFVRTEPRALAILTEHGLAP